MADESFRLAKEVEAARVLIDTYKDILGDDAALITDTLEGETNIFEKMETVLESIAEDEVIVTGLKAREQDIKDRRQRHEKRIEMKRALLLTAMQIAEVRNHAFPTATIARSASKPKLRIEEEADVPGQFFDPQPPKLNISRLTDALRARQAAVDAADAMEDEDARKKRLAEIENEFPEIDGARLMEAGESITIRRK